MEIVVSLKMEDYVYQFYRKIAAVLQKRPEELMEQALFQYAGVIAQGMIRNSEVSTDETSEL